MKNKPSGFINQISPAEKAGISKAEQEMKNPAFTATNEFLESQ